MSERLALVNKGRKKFLKICQHEGLTVSEVLMIVAAVATDVFSRYQGDDRESVRNWFNDRIESGCKEIPANG